MLSRTPASNVDHWSALFVTTTGLFDDRPAYS